MMDTNCASKYVPVFRYGYATNTKIKFVIVLQSSNVSLRDNEIKTVTFSSYFIYNYDYDMSLIVTFNIVQFFDNWSIDF